MKHVLRPLFDGPPGGRLQRLAVNENRLGDAGTAGFVRSLVFTRMAERERVIRLVDLAEYKRRQQPPGIKVTSRAFGRDRRLPITNRYRG